MSLVLRMSSVQYVHTKRFQTELVVFFQHYLQLQEVLGRMRAVSEGNEVSDLLTRKTLSQLEQWWVGVVKIAIEEGSNLLSSKEVAIATEPTSRHLSTQR